MHSDLYAAQKAADNERRSLLGTGNAVADQEGKGKVVKAAFYAVQVFYSFFIM
jgi:copper transporter 1